MTLVQIYVIGVITEAIYLAIKWARGKPEKKKQLQKELSDEASWLPRLVPLLLIFMCLLWPYSWIERLLFKKERG